MMNGVASEKTVVDVMNLLTKCKDIAGTMHGESLNQILTGLDKTITLLQKGDTYHASLHMHGLALLLQEEAQSLIMHPTPQT